MLDEEINRIMSPVDTDKRADAVRELREWPWLYVAPVLTHKIRLLESSSFEVRRWAAASFFISKTNPELRPDFGIYYEYKDVPKTIRPYRLGFLALGLLVVLPVFANAAIIQGIKIGRRYARYVSNQS